MQGGMRGWTKKQSRKFHPNQHNACSSLRSTIHYQPGIPGMEEVHVGKTHNKKRIETRDLPTRLAGWELLLFKCRHMFVLSRSLNHHPGQVLCATALLIHHMLMFHWTLQLSEHSLPVLIGYVQRKCLNRYHLKITLNLNMHVFCVCSSNLNIYTSVFKTMHPYITFLPASALPTYYPLIAIWIGAGNLVSVWDDLLVRAMLDSVW